MRKFILGKVKILELLHGVLKESFVNYNNDLMSLPLGPFFFPQILVLCALLCIMMIRVTVHFDLPGLNLLLLSPGK